MFYYQQVATNSPPNGEVRLVILQVCFVTYQLYMFAEVLFQEYHEIKREKNFKSE